MFGKNEVTSPFPQSDGSLIVNSLFHTLQGEGPDAGLPSIFLRLSKCNLRCHFCDTEFEKGERKTLKQLTRTIEKMTRTNPTKVVVITGGEPLLQNFLLLVAYINCVLKLPVSVETAGTVYLDGIERYFKADRSVYGNLIVCSPKTPKLNDKLIPLIGAFKYVLKHEGLRSEDGLPFLSTQDPGKFGPPYRPDFVTYPAVPIFVQPMDEGNDQRNHLNLTNAAEVCLRYGYRLSVQMHKLAGLP